ncbi:MAG: SHOCT domain-containing protein [Acidimicrobiia bacterium]
MQLSSAFAIDWAAIVAQPARWGHMDGWGWGMWVFGLVFMIAILGLVIWALLSAIRRPGSGSSRRGALNLLDERYARGEIEREEYLERRADLER